MDLQPYRHPGKPWKTHRKPTGSRGSCVCPVEAGGKTHRTHTQDTQDVRCVLCVCRLPPVSSNRTTRPVPDPRLRNRSVPTQRFFATGRDPTVRPRVPCVSCVSRLPRCLLPVQYRLCPVCPVCVIVSRLPRCLFTGTGTRLRPRARARARARAARVHRDTCGSQRGDDRQPSSLRHIEAEHSPRHV